MNDLRVETVPHPEIVNPHEAILRVTMSTTCGSDLHFIDHQLWSLCDNTNPKPEYQQVAFGYPTAGIYGYTHAFGGYAGAHAQFVRVPHADNDCFRVPEGLRDEQVLFLSDAAPTGYMGADFCSIQPGATIAVRGAGGVGLMAMRSAYLLGAERVIAVDRFLLATHRFSLEDAPKSDELFKKKEDGCVRAVFTS
ncbi:hypothetical protein [Corallococcus caeni]|uniref:Alcohol dehydrogenase N-terminal domain-containing protein n=1 Tax=Corallococcus caeni TaxID=3082388 RepID=A0ABQ6QV41_9BACT|nr:hypothetical protein ASNO1_41620 [Corallococcus sp. NO1]